MRPGTLTLVWLVPALAIANDPPWEELPPGPGRELTYGVCSGCHSMAIVKQQGMTRAQWDATLVWMAEEQGMSQLPAASREQVLDYLATVFSPDRPFYNGAD